MMTPQEHLEAARDYALKRCTAIEVNGITFSNLSEMLQYMDKQKNEIESLKAQIEKMKSDYDKLLDEKIELEDRLSESRECY